MIINGRIWLRGVICRCRIGVPDAERAKSQKILLDVAVEIDLNRPARTDDVEDALDYRALERRIRRTAQSRTYRLMERLAGDVADAALAFARRARSVAVRVHKKPSVMPKTQEVVVEISRRRKT